MTERYIYLLKFKGEPDYDDYAGFVIVAATATAARKLAAGYVEDDGDQTWLRSSFSSCQRVGITHRAEGVLLSDYRAG